MAIERSSRRELELVSWEGFKTATAQALSELYFRSSLLHTCHNFRLCVAASRQWQRPNSQHRFDAGLAGMVESTSMTRGALMTCFLTLLRNQVPLVCMIRCPMCTLSRGSGIPLTGECWLSQGLSCGPAGPAAAACQAWPMGTGEPSDNTCVLTQRMVP